MASIRSAIELQDNFTGVLYQVFDAVNMSISAMSELSQSMNEDVDTASFEAARASIDQATIAVQELDASLQRVDPEIDENTKRQEQFNKTIRSGADSAGDLAGKIRGVVGAYAGIAGIRKAFSFVQDCTEAFNTQLNAENQLLGVLSNMLDEDYVAQFEIEVTADTVAAVDQMAGIQDSVGEVVIPVSAETRALTAAFDEITAKAAEIQSKGIYGDEAMIAAAAEFSTYFSDTDAIKVMMDTLSDYAMGMSGGGEVGAQQMVDYATNLGKIMSGAYDAMTKKGFELSDTQKAIIEGTATQEQIVAALGEEYLSMSQDMQAAAAISQVIDESWSGLYENMSNTPEGRIIQMTNALGDMKETIGGQLYPYVLMFVDAITGNWGSIERIVQGITNGLKVLMSVMSFALKAGIEFADVIIDNWSWIGPIIYGVAAAMAVYRGYQIAANIAQSASVMINKAQEVAQLKNKLATGELTKAQVAETAAQKGLNMSMLACPTTWILIGFIAIIAIIYAAVAAVNKLTGSTYSATGVICGILSAAFAFILNGFITIWNILVDVVGGLWNAFASFANFLGNLFNDPVAAVIGLVVGMGDAILSVVEGALEALSWITFGLVDYADDIARIRGNMNSWFEENYGDRYTEYVETIDPEFLKMDTVDYGDAWDAGYLFGEGISDKVSDMLTPEEFAYPDLENYAGGLAGGVEELVENTGEIRDGLDITAEELKYLRDIAEKETVNRFTTAEIKIEQTNHNNVSGKMDLDGVVDGLTDAVNEAVDMIAEGVHE